MTLMEILKELNSETLVSFYDDINDTEKFYVGYYICSDDEFALFNLVTTRGYEDGLYLTAIDNIFRIDYDDLYTKKIEKLFCINNQRKIDFPNNNSELFKNIVNYSIENDYIVSIGYEDNQISGFVKEFYNDYIVISSVNEYGEYDGRSIVSNSIIEFLRCNSGDERNISLLNVGK